MNSKIKLLAATALSVTMLSSCVKKCECECCEEPESKTLTLQPGPDQGQDCHVHYRDGNPAAATANHDFVPELCASHWTYAAEGAGEGSIRSYIKFVGLSSIPSGATIKSAKLSLYGVNTSGAAPQGNSFYPGSPYNTYGDNKCWVKRVTGDWTETTITWANKPGTTDVNQVQLAASTAQWGYNVTDLDVTTLVKEMVSNNQNYGFCIQLQNEQLYRNVTFGSSERTDDATKRPKLVVEYETK